MLDPQPLTRSPSYPHLARSLAVPCRPSRPAPQVSSPSRSTRRTRARVLRQATRCASSSVGRSNGVGRLGHLAGRRPRAPKERPRRHSSRKLRRRCRQLGNSRRRQRPWQAASAARSEQGGQAARRLVLSAVTCEKRGLSIAAGLKLGEAIGDDHPQANVWRKPFVCCITTIPFTKLGRTWPSKKEIGSPAVRGRLRRPYLRLIEL
jgi:hypothetical protein